MTKQASGFDPDTGTWSALPNANNPQYRGGAACSLYQVDGFGAGGPTPFVRR